MAYYYKIYGLTIQSEIELPEAFETGEQKADVVIRYGEMPDFIKKKREENYWRGTVLRQLKWFGFTKEGNFLMENGNSITVELDSSADEKHTRSILLGACLGSILYQRQMLAFHGAAVVHNDEVIILCGDSGSGKSTISSELRGRGCLFMADDTVVITNEEGLIYANPAYPQQKLCSDAAIKQGYDLQELIELNEDCIKYAVRIKDSYCPDKKKVAALVCLGINQEEQLLVDEVTDSRKLEYILSNLYNIYDYKNIGMNTDEFRKCLEIAQKIPVIRVQRPADKNTAAEIVEQLIAIIDNRRLSISKGV